MYKNGKKLKRVYKCKLCNNVATNNVAEMRADAKYIGDLMKARKETISEVFNFLAEFPRTLKHSYYCDEHNPIKIPNNLC